MQSGFELLFARLCLSGPLLYVALHMLLEPVRFLTSLHMLSCVLRDFEHRLEFYRRQQPVSYPPLGPVSPRTRLYVRAFGMSLALFSFLVLTGLAE